MNRWLLIVLLIVLFGLLVDSVLFTIDEAEYGVLLLFGKPVQTCMEAGLYWKWPPPVHRVERFDKRLLVLDSDPAEYLTEDKKNVLVDSFLVWRIQDARYFLETVGDRETAESTLKDILFAELGAALGSHDFTLLVNSDPAAVKIGKILQDVTARCAERALAEYGIVVTDVHLRRLNFPEQNKKSVYERMRAERARIATRYRSEGKEEAAKIQADTDRETRMLLAAAYEESEKIRGRGEAEATRIYAESYGRDPDFYRFLRTLEAYKTFLDGQDTLVIPSDSELFHLLYHGEVNR